MDHSVPGGGGVTSAVLINAAVVAILELMTQFDIEAAHSALLCCVSLVLPSTGLTCCLHYHLQGKSQEDSGLESGFCQLNG